jgi:hypothetical protein
MNKPEGKKTTIRCYLFVCEEWEEERGRELAKLLIKKWFKEKTSERKRDK